MEIIQDAGDWKKVVDRRDGVTGWMNKILFSGKRYAITKNLTPVLVIISLTKIR